MNFQVFSLGPGIRDERRHIITETYVQSPQTESISRIPLCKNKVSNKCRVISVGELYCYMKGWVAKRVVCLISNFLTVQSDCHIVNVLVSSLAFLRKFRLGGCSIKSAMEEVFTKWVGASRSRIQSKHTPTLDTHTTNPML